VSPGWGTMAAMPAAVPDSRPPAAGRTPRRGRTSTSAGDRRADIYAAEEQLRALLTPTGRSVVVAGVRVDLPGERRFDDLDEVREYYGAVLTDPAVRDRWPAVAMPMVRARRGPRSAHWQAGVISLPESHIGGQWALREVVALHELAHHLTPGHGHDDDFVTAFMELIEIVLGPQTRFCLQVAYLERTTKQ